MLFLTLFICFNFMCIYSSSQNNSTLFKIKLWKGGVQTLALIWELARSGLSLTGSFPLHISSTTTDGLQAITTNLLTIWPNKVTHSPLMVLISSSHRWLTGHYFSTAQSIWPNKVTHYSNIIGIHSNHTRTWTYWLTNLTSISLANNIYILTLLLTD